MHQDNNCPYNLSNLVPEYKEFLDHKLSYSSVTKRNYLSDVRQFINWLVSKTYQGFDALENPFITDDQFGEYISYLTDLDLPRLSMNRKLSSMRNFFDYCLIHGIVKNNYARNYKNLAKVSKSEKLPSIDNKIFSAAEQLDLDEFLLIINSSIT